jgi:riboflavin kinase/FMN adenylyltransferase
MKIFHSLQELPPHFAPTIATIGNFDGVHCGHRWVIDQVNTRARSLGLQSLAITFDPHPVRIVRPEAPHLLITPLSTKLQRLATTDIDATLVLPFTPDFARLSAAEFSQQILCDALQVREVHEGENFRFGAGAAVDVHGLAALGCDLGFTAHSYPPFILRGAPVSSSRIRTLLREGDVSHARALLGRPFAVQSTPASGRGYGTRYAVPTINLAPYPEILPANGVYVTTLKVGDGHSAETFQGVTNVGNRPTFGADSFAVETHLLNFHPIPLSETTPLELTFLLRLRAEERFPSPDALRTQLLKDVARAQRFFRLGHSLLLPSWNVPDSFASRQL